MLGRRKLKSILDIFQIFILNNCWVFIKSRILQKNLLSALVVECTIVPERIEISDMKKAVFSSVVIFAFLNWDIIVDKLSHPLWIKS